MPGDVYLSLIRKMMNMEKQGNSTASQRRYIAAPSSAESDKLRLTSSAETYITVTCRSVTRQISVQSSFEGGGNNGRLQKET